MQSLYGRSHEITLTVPLNKKSTFVQLHIHNFLRSAVFYCPESQLEELNKIEIFTNIFIWQYLKEIRGAHHNRKILYITIHGSTGETIFWSVFKHSKFFFTFKRLPMYILFQNYMFRSRPLVCNFFLWPKISPETIDKSVD